MRERSGGTRWSSSAPGRTCGSARRSTAPSRAAERHGGGLRLARRKATTGASAGRAAGAEEIGHDRAWADLPRPGAEHRPAGQAIRIVTWAESPEARPRRTRSHRGVRRHPGNEDDSMEPFEGWLAPTCAGCQADRPERRSWRSRTGGRRVREVQPHRRAAEGRVPRHHRREARVWGTRHRERAEARRDRVGQVERVRAALDDERGRNAPIRHLSMRYRYEPVPGRIFVRGPLAFAEGRRPAGPS